MKRARLEVKWQDCILDNGGWESVDAHLSDGTRRGRPCFSIGFVLADDDKGLVLASSVHGDKAAGVVHIPAGMILRRRRLS